MTLVTGPAPIASCVWGSWEKRIVKLIHWVWIFHYLEHRGYGIDKKLGYREASNSIFSDLQAGTQQIAERSPFTESQLDGTTKSSGTSPFRRGFFPGFSGTRLVTSSYREPVQRKPNRRSSSVVCTPGGDRRDRSMSRSKKRCEETDIRGSVPVLSTCATEELDNGTIENVRLEVAHTTGKSFKSVRRPSTYVVQVGFSHERREGGRKPTRGICWTLLR